MIKVPKYYQKVKTLPTDPPGSIARMAQSSQATAFTIQYFIPDGHGMPYDDSAVIEGIHSALGNDQGLIEVKTGRSRYKKKYIYSIVKTVNEQKGATYTLTLQMLKTRTIYLQGFFEEGSTTGLRDVVVYEMLQRKGVVDDQFTGWMKDPYDASYTKGIVMNLSEDKQFDEMFPEHPLSMAREMVRYILENN